MKKLARKKSRTEDLSRKRSRDVSGESKDVAEHNFAASYIKKKRDNSDAGSQAKRQPARPRNDEFFWSAE